MEKNLGNKIHSHYIYHSDRESQIEIKNNIDDIVIDFNPRELVSLGFDDTSIKLIDEFIDLKDTPNWEKIVVRILKALSLILQREIVEARPISNSDISLIESCLTQMPDYDAPHQIKIEDISGGIQVHVLNKKLSPEYNGGFKLWRDTEFNFKLLFSKNLFVWEYLNVHDPYRGKSIGTSYVLFIEKMAKDLGFSRFSVENPTRRYWLKKLSYKIPYSYRIGSGRYQYTLEGYKTINHS
jgi:GNAT superfamily N-acetyltransferase